MKLSYFISVFALLTKVQQCYSLGPQKSEAFSELVPEKVAHMEPHFKVLTDSVKDMPFSLVFKYILKLTSLDPKLDYLHKLMNDIHYYVTGTNAEQTPGKGDEKVVGLVTRAAQYANYRTDVVSNEKIKSDEAFIVADTKEVDSGAESRLQTAEQEFNDAKAAFEDCYKNTPTKCEEAHKKLVEKMKTLNSKANEWRKDVDEKYMEAGKKANAEYEEAFRAAEMKLKTTRSECEEMLSQGKKEVEETTNKAAAEFYDAQYQCEEALNRANASPRMTSAVNAFMQRAKAKYDTEVGTATKKWEKVNSESSEKWNRVQNECQKNFTEAGTDQEKKITEATKMRDAAVHKYEKIFQRIAKEVESINNLLSPKQEKSNAGRKKKKSGSEAKQNGPPKASSNIQRKDSADLQKINGGLIVLKGGKSTT